MSGEKIESDKNNKERWLTIPNLITSLRIAGSPVLVFLGWFQWSVALAVFTGFLILTEWADGYLARKLRIDSAIGARLDTVADALFYSSMLIAVACLVPERLFGEVNWIVCAIASYILSWITSWYKFGCLPSYHTWMAKFAWCLVAPGVILMVAGWDVWLLRISMLFVVLTNLEAVLITRKLDRIRVDIPSIWHLNKVVS